MTTDNLHLKYARTTCNPQLSWGFKKSTRSWARGLLNSRKEKVEKGLREDQTQGVKDEDGLGTFLELLSVPHLKQRRGLIMPLRNKLWKQFAVLFCLGLTKPGAPTDSCTLRGTISLWRRSHAAGKWPLASSGKRFPHPLSFCGSERNSVSPAPRGCRPLGARGSLRFCLGTAQLKGLLGSLLTKQPKGQTSRSEKKAHASRPGELKTWLWSSEHKFQN